MDPPAQTPTEMEIMQGQLNSLMDTFKEFTATRSALPPSLPPNSQVESAAAATTTAAAAAKTAAEAAIKAAKDAAQCAIEAGGMPLAFVPPLTSNPASSVSFAPSSLLSQFPDVKAACITVIIRHDLKATDLYKLDMRYHDQETSYTFNRSTNQFKVSNHTAKNYKTPNSIIIPLTMYFRVLSAHIHDNKVTNYFFQYLTHLTGVASEYKWSAVFEYHSVFFNCRRAEMGGGDYSQWAEIDTQLMAKYLLQHRKAPPSKASKPLGASHTPSSLSDVCRNFNEGKCTVAKCPWGRPHKCSTCGKTDYGLHEHKD
ncbi:hypothetical protein DXG01_016246 [Tephrocybe rancida]|nr:hypothetical protein DXG01_016246 [Tephrocybe rancida]